MTVPVDIKGMPDATAFMQNALLMTHELELARMIRAIMLAHPRGYLGINYNPQAQEYHVSLTLLGPSTYVTEPRKVGQERYGMVMARSGGIQDYVSGTSKHLGQAIRFVYDALFEKHERVAYMNGQGTGVPFDEELIPPYTGGAQPDPEDSISAAARAAEVRAMQEADDADADAAADEHLEFWRGLSTGRARGRKRKAGGQNG